MDFLRSGLRPSLRKSTVFYHKVTAILILFQLAIAICEIFNLNQSSGEIAVYSFLMRCEDRKTFQCHPSYKTIGKALKMSENTVRKYVAGLIDKKLITAEPTKIRSTDGRKRNGSLLYTILPIEEAVRQNYEMQIQRNAKL